MILDAAARFGKRTTSRDLQLEIGEPPGGLVARGDPARTAQILTVLLDNTIAHTPEGTGVTVLARTQDNLVEVLVRDEEPGIPAEHLPRVFERFYRADKARSRASGGTGFGLSIARDLAHAQKGDLHAENAKGVGASFRLELPGPHIPRKTPR